MSNRFFSIVVEGGDQVGKGTALNNLIKYLSDNGVRVMPIAFPHYGMPIGAGIRKMLKSGYMENTDLSVDDRLFVKGSLYILDRLIFTNYVQSLEKPPFIIFDRGPYSNCVSIAYHYFHYNLEIGDDAYDIVKRFMHLERYLIKNGMTNNCTVRLYMKGEKWKPQRSGGDDINEVSDVQMLSNDIYEIAGNIVGEGWKDVVTKDCGVWKSHEEILNEIVCFIKSRFPYMEFGVENAKVEYLTTSELARSLSCIDGEIPNVKDLDMALRENRKSDIYEYGQITGDFIAKNSNNFSWSSDSIKEAIIDLFDEVNGLEEVINDLVGYDYGSKLLKSAKDE